MVSPSTASGREGKAKHRPAILMPSSHKNPDCAAPHRRLIEIIFQIPKLPYDFLLQGDLLHSTVKRSYYILCLYKGPQIFLGTNQLKKKKKAQLSKQKGHWSVDDPGTCKWRLHAFNHSQRISSQLCQTPTCKEKPAELLKENEIKPQTILLEEMLKTIS